jgi:hypothetical protein
VKRVTRDVSSEKVDGLDARELIESLRLVQQSNSIAWAVISRPEEIEDMTALKEQLGRLKAIQRIAGTPMNSAGWPHPSLDADQCRTMTLLTKQIKDAKEDSERDEERAQTIINAISIRLEGAAALTYSGIRNRLPETSLVIQVRDIYAALVAAHGGTAGAIRTEIRAELEATGLATNREEIELLLDIATTLYRQMDQFKTIGHEPILYDDQKDFLLLRLTEDNDKVTGRALVASVRAECQKPETTSWVTLVAAIRKVIAQQIEPYSLVTAPKTIHASLGVDTPGRRANMAQWDDELDHPGGGRGTDGRGGGRDASNSGGRDDRRGGNRYRDGGRDRGRERSRERSVSRENDRDRRRVAINDGICFAYKKGECTRGSGCRFKHDEQQKAASRSPSREVDTKKLAHGSPLRNPHSGGQLRN